MGTAATPGSARLSGTTRVVTWNLHGLRDDRSAAVDALRELQPDVLCAQEVPRFQRWRRAVDEFAAAAGLRLVAGGGSAGRGTAVLVAPHVVVTGVRYPRPGWWGSWRPAGTVALTRDPGLNRRALAVARLRLPAQPPVEITVASAHLGLQQEQRLRHVDEVLAALPLDDPAAAVVVAGDLNETADMPGWQRLAARLTDLGTGGSSTFPAHRPRARIDTVLVAGPVRPAVPADVPGAPLVDRLRRASDHLPVVADLLVG